MTMGDRIRPSHQRFADVVADGGNNSDNHRSASGDSLRRNPAEEVDEQDVQTALTDAPGSEVA